MSWKGLKKAINRLPYVIQAKTGSAEESVDEEFDHWNEQLQELDKLSSRLVDAAQKYKEALTAMLKHQESFAKTLYEVYQPIPGKFSSSESLNLPVAFANIPKKDRPLTPDDSLKRAKEFYETCCKVSESLIPKVDLMIDRQVLKPASDYVIMHKGVQKTIVKRSHKKIDYDRHNIQLKKLKERVTDQEDERKIVKMENTVETAFREYDQINTLLKTQLPTYLQLRVDFIDPVLEAMVFFQDFYFSTLASFLQPLCTSVDMSCSAVDSFRRKQEIGFQLIEEISILKGVSKSNSAPVSPLDASEEFDAVPLKPERTGQPPPAYTAVSLNDERYVALYDFFKQQQGDLSFVAGDVLTIKNSEGDWWDGINSRTGESGMFPSNYVKKV